MSQNIHEGYQPKKIIEKPIQRGYQPTSNDAKPQGGYQPEKNLDSNSPTNNTKVPPKTE